MKMIELTGTQESLELLVNHLNGNMKEAKPFLDAIWIVSNTFSGKYDFDLSSSNVMMRGDISVIIDPFKSYAEWVKTDTFMTYQQPKHLEAASKLITGVAK